MELDCEYRRFREPSEGDPQGGSCSSVVFRVFYPCSEINEKRFTWLPEPQSRYISGYLTSLGCPRRISDVMAYLPRHLYTITIPASVDAPVKVGRYPVVVFSHGLVGTRGAYSQLCGELASHGLVVVAPEHRDGSAIGSVMKEEYIDFVQARQVNEKNAKLRSNQLAQRKYEIECVVKGLREDPQLEQIRSISVLDAGKLIMSGHSFGAATAVGMCKSEGRSEGKSNGKSDYALGLFLDTWTLPLTSSMQLPLKVPSLTVLSQHFYEWASNLEAVKNVLAGGMKGDCYYVKGSVHLSQSDFQLLFPRLTKRLFSIQGSAEQNISLNVRAMVQFLHEHKVPVTPCYDDIWKAHSLGRVEEEDEELHDVS